MSFFYSNFYYNYKIQKASVCLSVCTFWHADNNVPKSAYVASNNTGSCALCVARTLTLECLGLPVYTYVCILGKALLTVL